MAEQKNRYRLKAFALVVQDNEILLSRWVAARRKTWTLPGSDLAPGEDPIGAARRHTLAETGLRVEPSKLLFVGSRVVPAPRTSEDAQTRELHIVSMIYQATIVGGELREPDAATFTDDAGWFPAGALPDPRVRLVTTAVNLAIERGLLIGRPTA